MMYDALCFLGGMVSALVVLHLIERYFDDL